MLRHAMRSVGTFLLLTTSISAWAAEPPAAQNKALPEGFASGVFAWKASGPLMAGDRQAADAKICVKDPTIVRVKDRWHIFTTVRSAAGKVDIEYASFADFKDADKAPRHVLNLHDKYYCAPEVFYFTPQKRWYLIYQIAMEDTFGPGFSTAAQIDDPAAWSKPEFLIPSPPKGRKWLDFWVICDETRAHLFYTTLAGEMYRCQTPLKDFPHGWSEPELAIRGDIFEASHTYKLQGQAKYLTLIEAQGDRCRYYKAYLADRLEGPWKVLSGDYKKPFAGAANVRQDKLWTGNISHGELLRNGCDEHLEVDPAHLRLLFQGASDDEYRGNAYGKIPWRLGTLEPIQTAP